MSYRRATAVIAVTLAIGAGCGHERREAALPTYPLLGVKESLKVLHDRAASVRTLSATGQLTLTKPDGASVRLDAAIVSRGSAHLRLRAWKLGRAVFDATVTPEGVWLLTPEDASMKERVRSAGVSATQFSRTWSWLGPDFFVAPVDVRETDKTLLLTKAHEGLTISCMIDRPTLTPRKFELADRAGRKQFDLELSRFVIVGPNLPYPHRLVARSAEGVIQLDLRQVEVNADLADGAFVPPRRAEKLP